VKVQPAGGRRDEAGRVYVHHARFWCRNCFSVVSGRRKACLLTPSNWVR
jgi:hypothetical protein